MALDPAVPFWDEGNTITGHASVAITGKRFVSIAGNPVDGRPSLNHAVGTATRRAVGVSARTAAVGEAVAFYQPSGIVMPVTCAEAITAGDQLYSAADGRAVKTQPAGAPVLAVAFADAVSGADCMARLV